MQGKYLLETSLVDGYLLEDGSGVLLLEASSIDNFNFGPTLDFFIKGEDFTNKTLKVASITVGVPTTVTQQTITIPNLGQPQAAMFIMNRCPSGSSQTVSAALNVGFADGTNELFHSINCQDNVTTSNTHRNSYEFLSMFLMNTDGTEDCRMSFVEWVQDGVTVDWITAPNDDYALTVILFAGGTNELQTYVGKFTTPDVLNSGVLVDVGFEPDHVIGIGGGGTNIFDLTTKSDAIFSYGFCSNNNGVIKQGSINYYNDDNLADTLVKSLVSQTYFARDYAGDFGAVELESFNSSGFTATTRVSGVGMTLGYLALKYNGNVKHGLEFISGPAFATGIQTISGVGFGPQFISELQTTLATYDSQATDFSAGSLGIASFGSGMVIPPSFQMNHNIRSQGAAATSNEDSRHAENTSFLRRSDEFGSVAITSTLDSLYYDGYSKLFTASMGTRRWLSLLIGNPIASGDIDLFIRGWDTFTEDINLFIAGHEYFIANLTKLYFYDELGDGDILRCDPDGSNLESFVAGPEIFSIVNGLHADASHDYLYWLEPGGTDASLRRIDIDGQNFVILKQFPDIDNVWNFDVSIITNTIYFTAASGIIQTSDLLGDNFTTIYNDPLDKPEKIVYDRQEDKIYWSVVNNEDSIYAIRRADSDGTNVENLFVTSPTERIYGLDLDRQRRKLYWANEAEIISEVAISRSNLDGSASGIVIPSGYRNIYEVKVDSINKKLYWGDIRTGSINRSDLDGQNAQVIVDLTAFSFDIPMSLYQRIYLPLSIAGFDSESNDCDLFVWGHQSITNDIDLFINGYDTVNNDIDLYTSGFINVNTVSNDIDLFIYGHNTFSTDIDLVITVHDTDSNSLDLFIHGHDLFSTDVDLVINGHDTNSESLDLFINGHQTITTDIDLFINGVDSNSSSLDLFIHGHGTISNDCDLYINGSQGFNNDIDLFIYGHGFHDEDCDLFIHGFTTFSTDVDLVIIGNESDSESLDLFIHGHQLITNDVDLFIKGQDDNSNDCDLFEHGHETFTNDIDLFIGGHQSFNNDIDLFVSGIGFITNDIDLFITSINIVASGIDLFIHGRDSESNDIDLIIIGSQSFNNNLDLTIFGKDNNSDDCNLFTHGKDTESNSIDLFINGSIFYSDSIDLYISGKDTNSNDIDLFISGVVAGAITATNDVDLFIYGHASFNNDIDLFIRAANVVTSGIDLVIFGPIFINDSIDLFVKQNDEVVNDIDLFIKGLNTPQNPACPALDPTLPVQISDDLIEIYQSRIDSLINQLGKNVLLEFSPIVQPCTNCEFDVLTGKSKGIFKLGGPIPFARGQKCPYCKGMGFLEEPVYKCIKCLVKWNPDDAKNYGISVDDPFSIVRFKAFLTDGDDMVRARAAISSYDITGLMRFRVVLIKEPIIVGLRESRYIISFWRISDS